MKKNSKNCDKKNKGTVSVAQLNTILEITMNNRGGRDSEEEGHARRDV